MVDSASGRRSTPHQSHRGRRRSIFSRWPHRLHEWKKGVFVADRDGANQRELASLKGTAYMPSVSPDGQTISITVFQSTGFPSLVEVAANGTEFRTAYPAVTSGGVWSSDGRYLLFTDNSSDIWALPERTGFLRRSQQPTRLTTGPLLYTAVCPSRDGKRLFALATRQRGELVRYDSKSRQFVPFLSGISAVEPTFSRDGKWVAYASYPTATCGAAVATEVINCSSPTLR